MKRLFQYAVILHKYDTKRNYVDSEVIIEPSTKLAKSEKDLVFSVTREIPEEHTANPDDIEIIVRNF
jgi:hypothetical protein